MKTTAFLTLTGTGTVMKLWLTQLLTAGAAAPELLLLVLAVAGLGMQTLHSDRVRERAQPETASTPALAPSCVREAIPPVAADGLLRA